jgi:hypothetical protein
VWQKFTLQWTFVFLLFAGIFAFATRTATDPDLWWHLRTGKLIVETGVVPHADPFSYSRLGQPWIAHEWLSDLALFGLYRLFHAAGLTILCAAIVALAFFFLYLRCDGKPHVAAACVVLGAFASSPVIGVRPQMFSFLLASLLLWLLDRRSECPSRVLWIPLIFLVWVNLHAGFALGLAILLVFAIDSFASSSSRTYRWRVSLAFLGSLAAVAANPNGFRMYSYPLEVLRSEAMQKQIAEWFSPNFHQLAYFPLTLLIFGVLVSMAFGTRKSRLRDLALLLCGLFAALISVRHVPIFVLVAVPVLSESITLLLSRQSVLKTRIPPAATPVRAGLNLAIVSIAAIVVLLRITRVTGEQTAAELQTFPVRAVLYLESHQDHGNLFALYDWGGYIIWRRFPDQKVFIDGRADLYGDAILRQFADTYTLRHQWRRGLEQACTVLVRRNSPLAQGLLRDTAWELAYEDEQSSLFWRQPAGISLNCGH